MVVTRPKRYRDSLQAHYTQSTPIVSFMVDRLEASAEDSIWEPCSGGGDLIDGVLSAVPDAKIRASEISEDAIARLDHKYRDCPSVSVHKEDALDLGGDSLFDEQITFSRIIANPPYGAYQSPERRLQLQRQFGSLYVKESYGVILYHALTLLKKNGRLVFIVPDTFLWLNRHETLRRKLVSQNSIEEIALFPSKFFPNINFGYSGLCIITLQKSPPTPNHVVRIINGFEDANALLRCIGQADETWPCSKSFVPQGDIADRQNAELVIENNGSGMTLHERANATLGDHAEIRTGFYSGNDRRWVRKLDSTVPRSKAYQRVDEDSIATTSPTLDGIDGSQCYIPIVKGGAIAFIKPTHWFVDWSCDAIAEYTRKGKNPARFQNSSFYFRDGVGIPMVASGRITGALLENRLFDQSIVGIFPHDSSLTLFLLGFLNSSIATELVRQINPTANNSANYIKRIPLVIPTQDELRTVEPIVESAINQARADGAVSRETQLAVDEYYTSLWCNPDKLANNCVNRSGESGGI